MYILGIDTSCDETAVAVVADGRYILSNVVASQIDIHARYGGVIPEVASRQHLLALLPVLKEALGSSPQLSGVTVTFGPGLPGALLVGLNLAKSLALAYNLPLLGINHLEGHIYAHWLEAREPSLPALCLVVSGGHTELVLMKDHGHFISLGRTRDDAAGEAFDKAARLLDLGYPGGPAIERAAQGGDPTLPLPRAWLKGNHDFSFSGLKTALIHLLQKGNHHAVADVAASFEMAVVDVLVTKTIDAALSSGAQQILVSGGVAANKRLRATFAQRSPLPVFFPSPSLCTDNAAMVAACGYFRLSLNQGQDWDMDIAPNLKIG